MIKSGDLVVVISGKDKSKTGIVRKVIKSKDAFSSSKVLVENVNMVKRRIKKNNESVGRIEEKESCLDISNVMLLDDNAKASRVAFKFDEHGKKYRVFSTTKNKVKDNFTRK